MRASQSQSAVSMAVCCENAYFDDVDFVGMDFGDADFGDVVASYEDDTGASFDACRQ
ncbi:uncharacterized protein YjbI with pentapeptide repeats [Rhodopirellula rubra]|uniref:Uncharacterized protein YjbI with pentapeptide repeats n=1 Tax=Aporhodopirellula rubra TaxID=980271 RepID=A0A7W5H5W9_9BACT|nr:hypothetical protein [Aporhodopirellula rubra]MBB3207937.1 uncharacterized protein YjbI with pentapeptide repeats [Aporhodopirellula rubra]